MEEDQSESGERRKSSVSDEASKRRKGRSTRRNLSSDGGGGPSLEGLITFFSIGSGVLIVLILGWMAIQYFGVFSSGKRGSDNHREHNREEFENKVKGDINVSEKEGTPFSTVKKREQAKELLKQLVQQIQERNAFRSRDREKIQTLQDDVLTIFDFIDAARGSASSDTLADKRKQAKRAETRMLQLRDQLVNTYNSNQHPKVREKIDKLNFDIVWKIQEELDALLDRNQ